LGHRSSKGRIFHVVWNQGAKRYFASNRKGRMAQLYLGLRQNVVQRGRSRRGKAQFQIAKPFARIDGTGIRERRFKLPQQALEERSREEMEPPPDKSNEGVDRPTEEGIPVRRKGTGIRWGRKIVGRVADEGRVKVVYKQRRGRHMEKRVY